MEKTPKFFVTGERGNWSVNTFDDKRGPVRLVSLYSRKVTALRDAKERNDAFERGASRHDLAAQIATLGADSLLPDWKP